MIARLINYLFARFNMLSDTQNLFINIIKKNISVYENLVKTQSLKNFIGENKHKNFKDNQNVKEIDAGNNNKKIINTKNSSEEKNENKININRRIKVINSNLGEETNRIKKSYENSEENIIVEQNSKDNSKLKRMSTKNYIKRDFALIDKEDQFSCFDYLFYMIFCKQYNSKVKYYEELRRLIISEECMVQNYLNIYKLLEINNFT